MRPTYCDACDGSLDPYLPDCPHCGAHIEHEDGHHDGDLHVQRGRDHHAHVEVGRRWRFHVPWGLFLVLGLYGAAAYGYVKYADATSPQNIAEQHLLHAQELMGPDNGDSASDQDLQDAYKELIEGVTLTPEDAWGHEQLEKLGWALAKRNQKPPADLKRRADFLSASYLAIQQGRASALPESPRERFNLDHFADSAANGRRYLIFGGLVIILIWAYKEFQDYKFMHKRDDEHEVQRREELRALNAHRRR